EAQADGRYADALRLLEARAASVEDAEVKQDGKPGKKTALELIDLSWAAIFARDFAKALDASKRSILLDPGDGVTYDVNRAHALMFLGRTEDARALYSKHRSKNLRQGDDRVWDTVIIEDFAQLRKAGLDHPLMAEIETLFKKSPAAGEASSTKP